MTFGYKLLADSVADGTKIHALRGMITRMPSVAMPVKEVHILGNGMRSLIRADRTVKSMQQVRLKVSQELELIIQVDDRFLNDEEKASFIWREGFRSVDGADIRAFCAFYGLRYAGNFDQGFVFQYADLRY